MQLLSSSHLKQVRLNRRALEVTAATLVGNYLLASEKEHIRQLTLTMIRRVLDLSASHPYTTEAFLAGSTNFAMWAHCYTRPCLGGLAEVYRRVNGDRVPGYAFLHVCADVIRLFGELAEKRWVPANDQHWHHMAGKGKLRPEPVFAKPEKSAEGWGHRHRLDKTPDELRDAVINTTFMPIPREQVALRGVEKFKFGDDSVIAALDWTYGLQEEGGDVSGTTTDSIAAMRWASGGQVHPVAQLIAIASMVPQGHHTIVECAWPLTRHKYMDYYIGFYDTLVPVGGYARLAGVLKSLDTHHQNKHVLVCRAMGKSDWKTWEQRGGRIIAPVKELALHFDTPDEIAVYRTLAQVRNAYGFCVGGRPTLDGLANLVRTRAPGLQGKRIIDSMFSKFHMA